MNKMNMLNLNIEMYFNLYLMIYILINMMPMFMIIYMYIMNMNKYIISPLKLLIYLIFYCMYNVFMIYLITKITLYTMMIMIMIISGMMIMFLYFASLMNKPYDEISNFTKISFFNSLIIILYLKIKSKINIQLYYFLMNNKSNYFMIIDIYKYPNYIILMIMILMLIMVLFMIFKICYIEKKNLRSKY